MDQEALSTNPIPKPYHTQSNPHNDALRMDQVSNAVAFLASPEVSSASTMSKATFLREKGLTDAEIEYAMQHSSSDPSSALQREWREMMDDVPRAIYWVSLFMGGVGVAACWYQWDELKRAAIQKYQFIRQSIHTLIYDDNDDDEGVENSEEEDEMTALKAEMVEMRTQLAFLMARQQFLIDGSHLGDDDDSVASQSIDVLDKRQ